MTAKEPSYKVSLSGGTVSIKDEVVSKEIARRIMNLLMGGPSDSGGEQAPRDPLALGADTAKPGSGGTAPTSKEFMARKRPTLEIERITCLAYYLTHYRSMPAFKTADLTKLNTEAAQPTFSNPSVFARNAVQSECLSLAGKGRKQITALGEAIVESLPDRDKVKAAFESYRSRRKKRTPRRKRNA